MRDSCLPLVFVLLVATGQAQEAATRPSAGIRSDLLWLCAPERQGRAFDRSLRVPRWIEDRFRQAGLQPLFGKSFLQPFKGLFGKGVNVGGILPGKNWPKDRRHVIISAHHDHLGMRRGNMYPGAADNAAGVAAMLDIQRGLKGRAGRLENSLVFLAFDLEEKGLVGSRHYCGSPAIPLDKTTAFTTMDILGREMMNLSGSRLAVLGGERSPSLATLAFGVSSEGLELVFVGTDVIGDRSDYAPFRDRRVPYLFFSTGENRDYHRPTDTVANLDLALLRMQAAYIGRVVEKIAALKKRPEFWDEAAAHPQERLSTFKILEDLIDGPDASMRKTAGEALQILKSEAAAGSISRETLKGMVRHMMLRLRGTWR